MTTPTITVLSVTPSTTVPDRKAVDATIAIDSTEHDVTLILDPQSGEFTTWGSLENWASWSLVAIIDELARDERREVIDAIVDAVREAWRAAK